MDLLTMMTIGAVFLFVIFFILLILLILIPPRPKQRYNKGKVSSDLSRIKEQINADEEEW